MHLLTFLKLKQPGPVFRFGVMVSQGVMFNAFFVTYLLNPRACHRFVGYIEEEAVHTYTTVRTGGLVAADGRGVVHSRWVAWKDVVRFVKGLGRADSQSA